MTFFTYRDVNLVYAYRPDDVEPQSLRKKLMGALRYGKPLGLDYLSLTLTLTLTLPLTLNPTPNPQPYPSPGKPLVLDYLSMPLEHDALVELFDAVLPALLQLT